MSHLSISSSFENAEINSTAPSVSRSLESELKQNQTDFSCQANKGHSDAGRVTSHAGNSASVSVMMALKIQSGNSPRKKLTITVSMRPICLLSVSLSHVIKEDITVFSEIVL